MERLFSKLSEPTDKGCRLYTGRISALQAANGNINPLTQEEANKQLVELGELQLEKVWGKLVAYYGSINSWDMHLSRRESLELVAYLARPNTPEWIPAMVKGLEKLGHTDYLILRLVKAARLAKRKRGNARRA